MPAACPLEVHAFATSDRPLDGFLVPLPQRWQHRRYGRGDGCLTSRPGYGSLVDGGPRELASPIGWRSPSYRGLACEILSVCCSSGGRYA